MYELIAQGPKPQQRWKCRLNPGQVYDLGRGVDADLPVPWDAHISRVHIRLKPGRDAVDIEQLPDIRNPVFFNGARVERCQVAPGEHFVIGATTFHLVGSRLAKLSPGVRPVEEVTFNRDDLQKVRFHDANKRIDVLTHLPELIREAHVDADLYPRLANLILTGVPHAEAVAIVKVDHAEDVHLLQWDRRRQTAGEFRPSARLAVEALLRRCCTVLHVWEPHVSADHDYTAVAEFDWAFCTPISSAEGDPWGLYVAGRLDRPPQYGQPVGKEAVELQADVKFTEIVAEMIGSVQRSNTLERRLAGYRQFLPPQVLAAIGENPETDLLNPRECDITVLFCDLRGFSQQAEELAGDLLGLLDRVSRALEVMTVEIQRFGGVTADFQGDAALGFWGWPFASDDAPLNACRAALAIRAAFSEQHRDSEHPLADFEMGIGIAHGPAVAGKIRTSEQVKITAYGPVINLASRLESLTKQLRVPILLDEPTAEFARRHLPESEGRIRKLARILPYGTENPVVVSEILPTEADFPQLTDEQMQHYETGVDHFIAGRWEDAYACLHQVPATDRAQDFLNMLITQKNRVAPPDWDGIVRLASK